MKRTIVKKLTVVIVIFVAVIIAATGGEKEEGITEAEAKALLDRMLKIYNEGNLALANEIFNPKIVNHLPPSLSDIVGIDAMKNYATFLRTTYSDLHLIIDDMIVKGDKIVVRWTLTGTDTGGRWGDLPSTGKKVRISGVDIGRVVDGKLVEIWDYYDRLDLFQQLGLTVTLSQGQSE